jgi:hypothetical protein
VGRYDVRVTIPGDASWCIKQAAEIDARRGALGDDAQVLPSSEAKRLSGTDSVLVLVWEGITAENGWTAAASVAGIASALLPNVYSSPYVRIAADLQDPDAERRRPLGA